MVVHRGFAGAGYQPGCGAAITCFNDGCCGLLRVVPSPLAVGYVVARNRSKIRLMAAPVDQ